MKQFIVLSAVIPILMIFAMQTIYDQRSNHSIGVVHDMVYVAKEQAREEGAFSPEIRERLRESISEALDVTAAEISITSREEDGLIFYRVEVPIKDVVAGNKLFGIKDEDNQYMYVIDSYTRAISVPEEEPEPDDEPSDDEGYNEDR